MGLVCHAQDLSSTPSDVAVSLNGLTHIANPDLARDLSHDLVAMLNHSRSHIRKRAVLALYKVFERYPEALQHSFPRLREKLEDSDPGEIFMRSPTRVELLTCFIQVLCLLQLMCCVNSLFEILRIIFH